VRGMWRGGGGGLGGGAGFWDGVECGGGGGKGGGGVELGIKEGIAVSGFLLGGGGLAYCWGVQMGGHGEGGGHWGERQGARGGSGIYRQTLSVQLAVTLGAWLLRSWVYIYMQAGMHAYMFTPNQCGTPLTSPLPSFLLFAADHPFAQW
jgi:hypothetical protein